MKLIAAIVFLFAVTASAQTAQVIQLKPEDAARAKELYAEKAKVDAQIEALKGQIQKQYLETLLQKSENCDPRKQFCYDPRIAAIMDSYSAWINGFEFSANFQFIVPAQPKPQPQCAPVGNIHLTGEQP